MGLKRYYHFQTEQQARDFRNALDEIDMGHANVEVQSEGLFRGAKGYWCVNMLLGVWCNNVPTDEEMAMVALLFEAAPGAIPEPWGTKPNV